MMADGVALVDPDAALGLRLLPVARQIFIETFADRFDRDALAAFCDAAYLPGGTMARDIGAADVHWRVAAVDGEPIGYAKLTPLRAPATDPRPGSMELQQIYLRGEWHGSGVADRLMQWAVDAAQSRGAPDLYLTVFDDNARAKRFYGRYGFGEVGRCSFEIGGRAYDDRIWRRRLLPV